MELYAGIVIEVDHYGLDNIFTYKVPEDLYEEVSIGKRVAIPFGMGNKQIEGYVYEIYNERPESSKGYRLKYIKEVKDKIEHFVEDDKKIIEFIRNKYLATYIDSIRLISPPGADKGTKIKLEKKLYLGEELIEKYKKEPYISIINEVSINEGKYSKNALSKSKNLSLSSINTLIKHGFLREEEKRVIRYDDRKYVKDEEKILTVQQKIAVDTINNSFYNKFLIHGVTGSGKTEVFIRLIEENLKSGKDTIILVPEISLTPQMVERIKGRLQIEIGIFHSKMTVGEKYDFWYSIKNGDIKVAIGPRSALFLPFNNLGLVIIDEEHENTYKSETDPKYDAREVAEYLMDIKGGKLILASATPSLESYTKGKNGHYKLIEMDKRIPGAVMPKIEVVDMRSELSNGNSSIFSKSLYEKINDRLEKKEQIILFLNRRGDSSFVSCRACGFVYKCPNCDVSLTLHRSENILECHYCGYKVTPQIKCPKCKSKYIKFFGIGTEKVERLTKKAFKSARVERMDLDTMKGRNSFSEVYERLKNNDIDILIGTQMITKGFDFKNVTLVGVLAADLTLNIPQYKSAERTFQLLTQVAGRAGRGTKEGEVVIQTYTPGNYAIQRAEKVDYKGFYNDEVDIRQAMKYPPFGEIVLVNLFYSKENEVVDTINILANEMKAKFTNLLILGPVPCPILKINNNFRYQIIIKGELSQKINKNIKDFVYNIVKKKNSNIKISVDINPNDLL